MLVSEIPLDSSALNKSMVNFSAGALVTFEGWVRNLNEGKEVIALEYEAYSSMAEKEGLKIIEEAKNKFKIIDAKAVHRVGKLNLGDIAVWVGVSSKHRGVAFDACEYIIDEIKTRTPIWKKEHYVNGDSGWVNCEHKH
ncbi:MAG: molybdenum cofactor biosynthesis protein MoaE [Cyanobacteriota bacterium]